jgi:hypothetical protein
MRVWEVFGVWEVPASVWWVWEQPGENKDRVSIHVPTSSRS